MNADYQARLNRVIDYIDSHLTEQLDLDTLAGVASFSRYHFHRIFSAVMGETPGAYIQRLRLEKAAGHVAEDERPITEIAMDLGFSSPSVFSRAFSDYFGVSPNRWRRGEWKDHGKNSKLQSNRYQPLGNYREATRVSVGYDSYIKRQWRVHMKTETNELEYQVEIRDLPEKTVAYIRHTGPYAGDGELFGRLFGALMRWAGPRDLVEPGKTEMLTIYHDSPEITEEDKLRISVCMTVPEDTKVSGEIGLMTVPAGRYAVAEFLLTSPEQYGDAWNSLFGGWFPESGYQCTEGPCYELYLNDPDSDPQGRHHVAIHVPVKVL